MYRAPRGTFDILPEDQPQRRFILDEAMSLCQLYGYQRLDTPIFEDYQLFARSSAGGTDVVDKEMYVFEDRSQQKLALRPEGTAPVCRAYLEHGMFNWPQPVRLYYWGPTFRYERPQAGRYRQHHQFGCEALGDSDPALDAELIEMAERFLARLGIGSFVLYLNSIGCKQCQPGYREALQHHFAKHVDELCPDCRTRLSRNPLRLLDCKRPSCQAIAATAPPISGYLCPDCRSHFESVQSHLARLGIDYRLEPALVRGLDYYTRTVFEVQPDHEAAQSALVGGGRYDNLVEQLGGKPTPGVGFACGIERLVLGLSNSGVVVPPSPYPEALVASLGAEAKGKGVELARQLRDAGIGAIMSTGRSSLKAQLRQANALGARYVLIIGEDEVRTGTVMLRDMAANKQETLPADQAERQLRHALGSTPQR